MEMEHEINNGPSTSIEQDNVPRSENQQPSSQFEISNVPGQSIVGFPLHENEEMSEILHEEIEAMSIYMPPNFRSINLPSNIELREVEDAPEYGEVDVNDVIVVPIFLDPDEEGEIGHIIEGQYLSWYHRHIQTKVVMRILALFLTVCVMVILLSVFMFNNSTESSQGC